MFAKSGFVLRSLFVASFLGSLVACTFEDGGPEKQGQSSQNQTARERGADQGDDQDSTGADASATADGGTWGHDSGVSHDGGSGHDSGIVTTHDGGAWGSDGGTVSVDAGAWGDDDDDFGFDGGSAHADGGGF